ncbi:hypothetical protein FKM82_013290 [Ascaphus truei]
MPLLTMGFRALIVLVVFLQLSYSSPLPARNKRHVDGMYTSEFGRVRGTAAIRKIINSALAGKRDVEENSFQTGTLNDASGADSQRKVLAELTFNNLPEPRSEERVKEQEVTEAQLCSAMLYLLNRVFYQSQQELNS